MEWLNVFADNEETLDSHFERFGTQFFDLYKMLKASPSIRFALSAGQQFEFHSLFEQVQNEYSSVFGIDFVASVRRLGLITFRIAMILTAVRIIDNGDFPTTLVCSDSDFKTAKTMVQVLLKHTAKVYQILPTDTAEAPQGGKNHLKQQYLIALPPDFDKQTAIAAAPKPQNAT